jgi:plastocyanin domain-containing protein
MKKNIITAIIVSVILIAFALIITNKSNQTTSQKIPVNNVSIVNNVQIIELQAKGGYTPRTSKALAGIPTILRINTNGTFDCSSSVRIPTMNIFKNLPQSGTTDIDLGIQKVGKLQGTCGMGMYPFEINFSN